MSHVFFLIELDSFLLRVELMTDFLFDDILPDISKDEILNSIATISRTARAVVKSLPRDSGVLAYSGGIDSAIMASLILDGRSDTGLMTLGRTGSSDLLASQESRLEFAKTEILFKTVERSEIERAALRVAEIVSVTNLAHFEDCIAFWLIAERAKENGETSYVVSANGPDELFCGYDRFRRILDSMGYEAVEREIIFALKQAESLGSQIRVVLSQFGLRIFEPFLQEEFRKAALDIEIQQKIMKGNRDKKIEFTTVSIPKQLFEKVEKHISTTGFPSVSSYVAFILREVLSEKGNKKADYEAEIIRNRLKELGYI